jgi:hypothetical protein
MTSRPVRLSGSYCPIRFIAFPEKASCRTDA